MQIKNLIKKCFIFIILVVINKNHYINALEKEKVRIGSSVILEIDKSLLDTTQLDFISSAQAGEPNALYELGKTFLAGNSILGPYNPSYAAELFEIAAHSEHVESMFQLGNLYSEGRSEEIQYNTYNIYRNV